MTAKESNYFTGLLVVVFIFCFTANLPAQNNKFRKAIFLHHSTGGRIYGPNGSNTSVPAEAIAYNSRNGLTGVNTVSMAEGSWPGDDNEWEHWHRIFEGKDNSNIITNFYKNYPVIIIKSCYPSSSISSWGSALDTLQPTKKSVYNYKWHFRNIIRVMRNNPDIFYVIWTNAPLVAASTNNTQALLSDQFCRWAKDTLEKGLDTGFGAFPSNVFIFDFFHKLAGSDGKLPLQYAASSGDSHPNSAATQLVAPQFVAEVFDAAIKYENRVTGIKDYGKMPEKFLLMQNYPNPFNPATKIEYSIPEKDYVSLKVFDISGSQIEGLVNEIQAAGKYTIHWKPVNRGSGIYYLQLKSGNNIVISKVVFLK